MAVERFEQLVAWQKARVLTREIYLVTRSGELKKDFGLRDQMERSAVSIMSNIAEGFERARRDEFTQFLSVAKASCAELRSQLYIALDVGYLNTQTFQRIHTLADEVARIITGLKISVARQPSKTLPQ